VFTVEQKWSCRQTSASNNSKAGDRVREVQGFDEGGIAARSSRLAMQRASERPILDSCQMKSGELLSCGTVYFVLQPIRRR
jgi:hypothetical protein